MLAVQLSGPVYFSPLQSPRCHSLRRAAAVCSHHRKAAQMAVLFQLDPLNFKQRFGRPMTWQIIDGDFLSRFDLGIDLSGESYTGGQEEFNGCTFAAAHQSQRLDGCRVYEVSLRRMDGWAGVASIRGSQPQWTATNPGLELDLGCRIHRHKICRSQPAGHLDGRWIRHP